MPIYNKHVAKIIKYKPTNFTVGLNTVGYTRVPLLAALDFEFNPFSYTVTGDDRVQVGEDGLYRVTTNIRYNRFGGGSRIALQSTVFVNFGLAGMVASTGYIRNASGHNTASLFTQDIFQLSAGDIVALRAQRQSSSTAYVSLAGADANYFLMEKIG